MYWELVYFKTLWKLHCFRKKKVKYIIKTCARFTRGKVDLEVVLGSQNCVFEKAGIGYNSLVKRKSRSLLISFQLVSQLIYLWLLAIIVWEKVMFLRTAKQENMMYLRDIWNGSQRTKKGLTMFEPTYQGYHVM